LFPYAFLILSLRPLGYDRLLIPGPKQQAGDFQRGSTLFVAHPISLPCVQLMPAGSTVVNEQEREP
jgi:hypothetical protein